ncbi:MAG: hypothetical protein KGI37_05045 [Alphaproteobacteria bacterium]|nr:hypothetical protein [Alphaproteobacteria bacterium]
MSLSLVIGQGPLSMAVAMPAINMDQMSVMANMSGMGMTASASDGTQSEERDCCSQSTKDRAMKGGMCGACCVAMAQIGMLPAQFPVPIQYGISQFYGMTDTSAISRNTPPDPPRPKV